MVDGPFTAKPLITTGAGDHFNSGFCLGRLLGLDNAHEPADRRDDQRILCSHRRKAHPSSRSRR